MSDSRIEVQRTASPRPVPPDAQLGFGKHFTDHMFVMEWTTDRGWHAARVVPFADLPMSPAAAVLHYAQTLFEGFKAFRAADGSVRLFRVDRHFRRMRAGTARLCVPPVDDELAMAGLRELLRLDGRWVPSSPGTALYLRPTLVATEPFLGVRPAERYTYFIIACPVGAYYAEGLAPVKIWVEREQVRAAPGGLGAVKTGANYAASLHAAMEAKSRGYAQVLWLDAVEHRFLEEVGTMNLFVRIGDEVVTPPISGTILDGVTRDSALTLLREWGVPATERRVSIDEVAAAHDAGKLVEVFGTGTAAVISPVGELGLGDRSLTVGGGRMGDVAQRLYEAITAIQYGRAPDRHGWITAVETR